MKKIIASVLCGIILLTTSTFVFADTLGLSNESVIEIKEPVTVTGDGLINIKDASKWKLSSLENYVVLTHKDNKWSIAKKEGQKPLVLWENGTYLVKGTLKIERK